ENAIINSAQSVAQASNTISSYTEDMSKVMEMLEINSYGSEEDWEEFVTSLLSIRTDIVAITNYNMDGVMIGCWSENEQKVYVTTNLSYDEIVENDSEVLNISKPHVETLFENDYPWVVTISSRVDMDGDEMVQIGMDIQFSEIANYIDNVGIGQHGYCFIVDEEGSIIYHPQQQLINSGIKEEDTEELAKVSDGSYTQLNVIYTLNTIENCGWRVVGVSYVDEMITDKVESMITISVTILIMVFFTILGVGIIFAMVFSNPAKQLKRAMEDFEKHAENFEHNSVGGTKEIVQLSDSFGHMVVRIQELMEKVRKEEISLRKTELNALQAQINPHFLYNTLDSIAWMCEEERTKEAVEMVNALAKLFRISISKGHELITIEKELQHASSYLQIQNVRYRNQFTYEIEADESCMKYLCNKITLQPIIENAIYHGLDRMVDEGKISIRIYPMGDDIVMEVEDNGLGMTEEQCKEILHREAGDRTGIGIKNVHDRVQIYFGEFYGLSIESELDEGTKVLIRMPKISEGEYDENK
ncbi:MAG: sensor histidine kinase, partial [Eubacteriales bacterium]